MSEQVQELDQQATPTADLQISDQGIIGGTPSEVASTDIAEIIDSSPNVVIDLTDTATAIEQTATQPEGQPYTYGGTDTATVATEQPVIQTEGQPYTYGGDAGDLKIGANPNDISLQAKAQGNYPSN